MRTEDIITTVERMKARGVEFLDKIPNSYYDRLIDGLKNVGLEVAEDIEVLRKHKILIDYDKNGYLLQIFTKNIQDRPTFFCEVIQRRNH
jgi:4-hydroxyphenylpyruvate dioxygenase